MAHMREKASLTMTALLPVDNGHVLKCQPMRAVPGEGSVNTKIITHGIYIKLIPSIIYSYTSSWPLRLQRVPELKIFYIFAVKCLI